MDTYGENITVGYRTLDHGIQSISGLGDFRSAPAAERYTINPYHVLLGESLRTGAAISPMLCLGGGLEPYIIRHCQPSVSPLRFEFLPFQFLSFHSESSSFGSVGDEGPVENRLFELGV